MDAQTGGAEAGQEEADTVQHQPEPYKIAKDLAQAYFADIPVESDAGETRLKEDQPSGSPEKEKEAWQYGEDASVNTQQQMAQLLQIAQQTAYHENKEPEEKESPQIVQPHAHTKHFIREKRWQRNVYWLLLPLIFLIPVFRIILGRMSASVEQFNWMQSQMVPSILYFIVAAVLLYHLLRRTTAPNIVSAGLLLLPLLLDYWYLLPGFAKSVSPGLLLNISSAAKIAVSLFALVMSSRTKKHPALRYKR